MCINNINSLSSQFNLYTNNKLQIYHIDIFLTFHKLFRFLL